MMRRLLLVCFSISNISKLLGLSSETAISAPKPFIDIVNPLGRTQLPEKLPASLIQEWPTWICDTATSTSSSTTPTPPKWRQIESGSDHDVPGLVNPFSIDYIWQPVDLNPPECKLALAIHCRNGVPRHLLPAIDVAYGADRLHRNRGLHTSPRAWKWFDFRSFVAGTRKCRLELRTYDVPTDEGPGKGDTRRKKILQTFDGVDDLVDRMLLAISDDPPKEVGAGSVIVQATIGLPSSFLLPKQNQVLSAVLVEDDDTLIGSLDVMIQAVSAGSQSEYLPDAYRSLFREEIRPEFNEYQERKAERGQQ